MNAQMIDDKNAFFERVSLIHDEEELIAETDKHLEHMKAIFNWTHYKFDHLRFIHERIDYIKSIYESKKFWSEFDSIDDFDRALEYLRNSDYDLIDDSQPDAVLTHFGNISREQADQIADVFMEKYGKIILCTEASFCEKKIQTIVDCLEDKIAYDINDSLIRYDRNIRDEYFRAHLEDIQRDFHLLSSFVSKGLLSVVECGTVVLVGLCHEYDLNMENFKIKYDYEELRNQKKWLKEDLSAYLYHPRRIEMWLNAGNELEDYMN